jgi:hypothetical protein
MLLFLYLSCNHINRYRLFLQGRLIMRRHKHALCLFAFFLGASSEAPAEEFGSLYVSQAIVTGQGEANREFGLRDCLERVLVRVSGDQRLLAHPRLAELRQRAASFISGFSYRDRLAGKPIHDEQGTYDRPHDLTCRYDPTVVDHLLADLGARPWLAQRPALKVFLEVKRNGQHYWIDAVSARDQAMREAFQQAASPMAMSVVFSSPAHAAIVPDDIVSSSDGGPSGAALPILGTLVWSDPNLGWVATWRFRQNGKRYQWQVKGVSFDEAFRVAIRGAAQILSGNGAQ